MLAIRTLIKCRLIDVDDDGGGRPTSHSELSPGVMNRNCIYVKMVVHVCVCVPVFFQLHIHFVCMLGMSLWLGHCGVVCAALTPFRLINSRTQRHTGRTRTGDQISPLKHSTWSPSSTSPSWACDSSNLNPNPQRCNHRVQARAIRAIEFPHLTGVRMRMRVRVYVWLWLRVCVCVHAPSNI